MPRPVVRWRGADFGESLWAGAVLALAIASAPAQHRGVDCPTLVTHADAAGWDGFGSVVAQAGFQETDIAAASYEVAAGDFPLRIDLAQMLFLKPNQDAATTTRWSVILYRGRPDTGTVVATFSSNGATIPHVVVPAGFDGDIATFDAATMAPAPVMISAPSMSEGANIFSVGFRVDEHNVPPAGNPCFFAPPADSNAFPTTDVDGLNQPARNWIRGINCGAFGCPVNGGWSTFGDLPGYCRPSGDWKIRATYTPAPCIAAPCEGDADGDDDADFNDVLSVLANFGSNYLPSPGTGLGDADRDGDVDFNDILNVLANFGVSCA